MWEVLLTLGCIVFVFSGLIGLWAINDKGRLFLILQYVIIVGMIIVGAHLYGIFEGVILGALATFALLYIHSLQSKKKRQEAEKAAEKETEQKKHYYAEFFNLIESYIQSPNHSVQETKEAWAKYNGLLQAYGVEKTGSTFKIFLDVHPFLEKENLKGFISESVDERRKFYFDFAANLWNFYYQVAFTYDLMQEEQEDLLQYLAQCFYGDEERTYFEHTMRWSFGNLDKNTWNQKYLALWEKGSAHGSVSAVIQLAECYYKGILVDLKDYDKAFSLFQQAVKLGNMDAAYMLGQCYENARGTRRDYQKAGDCYMYAYSNTKNKNYSAALTKLYDGNRWDKNKYSPDIFDYNKTPVMKKENLAKLKLDLENCMLTDLNTADLSVLAVSIGMINEQIINSFIACYASDYQKENPSEKIKLLRDRGYFTKEIAQQAHTVRLLRNRGAHNGDGERITPEEMTQAMHHIHEIVEYYETY